MTDEIKLRSKEKKYRGISLDELKLLSIKESALHLTARSRRSVLRHPEIIERYEKIYPGAAKMIFEEWDNQVKHRQGIEKSIIKTDNFKSILGIILGFCVVIVAIFAGVYTALRGLPLFGGGLSLAGLAMLVTAFITSRKKNKS